MKKAKRLLAVLLAALMLASAACLPVYAKLLPANDYSIPKVASNKKFYFSPDQGAGWLLDMLDDLLGGANLKLDLLDMTGIGEGVFKFAGVNLEDIDWTIDLTTIDKAIYSLDVALEELDGAWLGSLASGLGLLGDLLKDKGLNGAYKTLDSTLKRGTRDKNYSDGGTNDLDILYMLINWIEVELKEAAINIVAGTFDFGLLADILPEMLSDLPGFLKLTIYQLLVDSEASALPTNTSTPIDDGLQQMVNWLLIEGTGDTAATGANSLVGANATPLIPGMATQPGQANLKGVAIKVDRNGDGVLEDKTMSFYQLIANVIQGFLSGEVATMLGDLIADLVGVEITEQYPMGDPALLQDMMFNTILGAVESLAVQNGAPKLEYTEEENSTPMGKINALMNWFFTGGGLDTFIKIDFYGIGLTDNFMSLLGDLARLAINLLPGLVGGDIFEGAEKIAYTADQLNEVRCYKENSSGYYVSCDATDPDAIGETYLTYEAGEVLYATDWDPDTETPTAYNYLSNNKPVNTSDPTASDYRNISLIRSNYVITTDMVYACLIKMLLNGLIDGCYWPEWTTDIPSVLAYAMAALAAPTVPEGNYFARLDAYHYTGGIAPVADSNGVSVEPIPYYTIKNGIEVPTGALKIGASVAAFYLNAIFTFDDAERLTEEGTNFEQFVAEFLIWAADEYLPMLVGEYNVATGKFAGDGLWVNAMNNLIGAIYSDFATRTVKPDANWDGIYTFIDNTLLKLIPIGWLPGDINSSFDLFNGWLLNNLLHFDLQGILSLFSTNPDESAELYQPALTVVLRVVDRVLGLVFNGTPMLLPISANRTGANENGVANVFINNTSITSLDALLAGSGDTSGSLPQLVSQLLTALNKYKKELVITIFPLIMGGTFDKPYDKEFDTAGNVIDSNWLGTNMTVYGVDDLELYISWFREDVNAVRGATYNTEEEAEAAITDEDLQYIKSEPILDELGKEILDENGEATYTYTIYTRKTYYDSATETKVSDTSIPLDGDMTNDYSKFSGFKYSKLIWRTTEVPYTRYEDMVEETAATAGYRFLSVEDWKVTPYAYHNIKTTLDKAEDYASSYRSFAENDLGAAYGEWMRYFIQTRLYSADLLDTNGDGRCVISDTDSDYVASTDTDPGYPVDGMPGAPSSGMFPYFTTDGNTYSSYTYLNSASDKYEKLYPTEYTRQNFEQLDMALKFGENPEYNVVLEDYEAEEVVRLAIASRVFDITGDENGAYEAGSIQWEGLSSTQITQITNLCNSIGYVFVNDEEGYRIERPRFRLIDASYTVGCGVDANPPMALSGAGTDGKTYSQEVDDYMYNGYVEFMSTLTKNRKSIYNYIDHISDRMEEGSSLRTNSSIDTTMLKWALTHTDIANAYKNAESKVRNYKITGIKDDGSYYYSKVYTQSTYDEFRKAYDYADCLNQASTGAIQAYGLTQGMVTQALKNLLATYGKLVEYTGDADWTQLEEYINYAIGVRNDPDNLDAVTGFTEDSLNNLLAELVKAEAVRADSTIDCERQQDVDAAAAELLTAINNLVYNSVPNIAPVVEGILTHTTSAQGATRTQGHVFGLEEGQGITLDLIEIIGMRIDEGVGNNVTVEDSGKGTGTGAYFKGTVGNLERFRFYAVLYGDINGDTRIDGTDRTAIDLYVLQGVNNSADPSSGGMGAIKFEAGDVNHNGVVDAEDSALIELHYNYSDLEEHKIEQGEHGPTAQAA